MLSVEIEVVNGIDRRHVHVDVANLESSDQHAMKIPSFGENEYGAFLTWRERSALIAECRPVKSCALVSSYGMRCRLGYSSAALPSTSPVI